MVRLTTHIITVIGVPAGQGAIRYSPQGRGYHPNAKVLKPWRNLIRAAAAAAISAPHTGPVRIEVTITLARPAAHYRTGKYAHLLRDDAPAAPFGANTGDWDHYGRAVSDALTGAAYVDDCQVVDGSVTKVYAGEGVDALDQPGAVIRVRPLAVPA